MKKITAITIMLLCIICLLAGCSPKEVETAKRKLDGRDFIAENVPNLTDVKMVQYESYYKSYRILGRDMSFSPSDPGYRGIITLSEEEGQKLMQEYTWTKTSDPLPEMLEIDLTSYQGQDWYYSDDFYNDYFRNPTMYGEFVRFNGTDTIIFDYQSH